MTYLEAYRQCKTEKELRAMIKRDVLYAMFNKDRIPFIEKAMTTVADESGWDLTGALDKGNRQ